MSLYATTRKSQTFSSRSSKWRLTQTSSTVLKCLTTTSTGSERCSTPSHLWPSVRWQRTRSSGILRSLWLTKFASTAITSSCSHLQSRTWTPSLRSSPQTSMKPPLTLAAGSKTLVCWFPQSRVKMQTRKFSISRTTTTWSSILLSPN